MVECRNVEGRWLHLQLVLLKFLPTVSHCFIDRLDYQPLFRAYWIDGMIFLYYRNIAI